MIAREQKALEDRLGQLLQSEKSTNISLLFCDTTPLLTSIYSRVIFGKADDLVDQIAQQHDYDITLFTQCNVPWVADGIQRDGLKTQAVVHEMIKLRLEELKIPYQTIFGSSDRCTQQAQEYVASLIK